MIGNSTIAMEAVSCQAASKEELLARLLDDYLSALESGAPLDLERLVSEHPDLADDIRMFAESLDVLHQVTQRLQSDPPDLTGKQDAKRLGDFEIGPEIGRGGMGVVYEARQISLDRIVALKVLPFAAVWDEKQIARFRNEAQAAAQLHHPNIVPVFAVGQQRGVHFYAMQYIAGQSLGDVIRELRRESAQEQPTTPLGSPSRDTVLAATTQRIAQPTSTFSQHYAKNRAIYCRNVAQLGIQAAEALHHAHEYGVLHRDIKPSNLLVDPQGKLWVTDFGLARVQNSPGVTVTGDVMGTLRYMSPEQAAGENALVDTRTDIYGLGATLYELLTLRVAFPGEDRHQVLRAIETEEPPLPRVFNPDIPIDLETIVLQAMSKARDSRYGSAQALAEDLNRFLEGKPTLARRPTIVDRTAKWLRRHRLVTASAALVLVLFTTVATLSAILLAREKADKEAALVQSQQHLAQSQANFRQARQVVDRFGIQLADQLQGTPGTERLRQQLMMETLNYYRGFLNQIGTGASLQEQLAMTHLKAGVVTSKLGADKKAIDEYRAAQQILTELIVDHPDDPELQSQRALSRNNLALLLARQGDTGGALAEYEQAISTQQHLVATNPANKMLAGHLAESHVNRGTLLGQLGEPEAAIQSLTHAVTILHETCAAAPDNRQQARNLAIAHNNLSFVQRRFDTYLAEKSALRAVEILQQFAGASNTSDECRSDLALCYGNLAAIQGEDGRTTEAIESYHQTISLYESLVRKSPGVVRYRSELAASLNNRALLEIRTGDITSGANSFRSASRCFAALLVDYPDQMSYASGWAALLNNQAMALAKIKRYDDAIAAYQQAIEVQRKVVDQLDHCQPVKLALSRMVYNYGQVLQSLGRWGEAHQLASTRRELWQGNGQRLFGVAAELAQIAQRSQGTSSPLDPSAALDTLHESLSISTEPPTDLAADPRFESLHNLPGFDDLVNGTSKMHRYRVQP
jgi:hypothetical protein